MLNPMHSYRRPVKQIFKFEVLYQRRKSFDLSFIQDLLVGRNDNAPRLLLQRLNSKVAGNTRSQGNFYTYPLVEVIYQNQSF